MPEIEIITEGEIDPQEQQLQVNDQVVKYKIIPSYSSGEDIRISVDDPTNSGEYEPYLLITVSLPKN